MAIITRLQSILLLTLLVLCIEVGEASKMDPVPRSEDSSLSEAAINALWENWHPSRDRQDLYDTNYLYDTNRTDSTLSERDSSARVTKEELETAMCNTLGIVGPYRRFLWSGEDADTCIPPDKSKSVEYPAGNLSAKIDSTTLESALNKTKITMPDFTERDEEAQDLWRYASRRYAQCAADYVVFFKGRCTRPGNVFITIELPTLKAGTGVNCVFQVTSADKLSPTTYWVRDGHDDDCKGALEDLNCQLSQISD